ncbi:uncharacterized protein LOC128473797 [Spea bombifrons]|uniref:uncharacterized protein LOC128473797 n=1 Tax=Spea bombifrons TaxID=233779 RepID=UPI002349D12A|nr:uncharacterized protein LOC128473797 [Spea bombifrons]
MDSGKWMDVDGAWVYSAAPVRHPENHLRYNTLPGRDYRRATDVPRRPVEGRGIYGTIPGRFGSRGPFADQSPHSIQSMSSLSQTSILQDSTNWVSSLPLGARGPKMVKMEQKTFGGRYDASKNHGELEKKRRKLLRETEADMRILPSYDKHRRKGKPMEVDTIYEGPHYTLHQKNKNVQNDDWEPLTRPPKALQNQLETPKMHLNQTQIQSTKPKAADTNLPTQEKRKWWFKSQKQSKPGEINGTTLGNTQEASKKTYVDCSTLKGYEIQRQGSKENLPKVRKRKVPPPYIPPPSYNSPHLIFPMGKDMHSGIRQKATDEIVLMTGSEIGQSGRHKVSRYTEEPVKKAKSTLPHIKKEQEEKRHRSEQIYRNYSLDRRLPWAYSILGNQRPLWHLNQPSRRDDDFLDHIYETVEGGGSPLSANVPSVKEANLGFQTGERIYGTLPISHHKNLSKEYILPRRENKDVTKSFKKSKMIANGNEIKVEPFDVLRPPITSDGIKLPHELGFSYTSGKFQYMDKGQEYRNTEEPYKYGTGNERRKPLRVVSSKERRSQDQSAFISGKEEYGYYSQTLPWKKDMYDRMKTSIQDMTTTDHSSKQKVSSQPGKVSTLPGRGHDQSHRKLRDGVSRSVKYSLLDPSKMSNGGTFKRGQMKEIILEKIQLPSKESDGMFVIDATCVVVKAEYIFPPRAEQVKFLPSPQTPEGLIKNDILCGKPHLNNKVSKSLKPAENVKSQHSDKKVPSMKERAIRILGLSAVELETLNEEKAPYETTKETYVESEVQQKTLCKCTKASGYKCDKCAGVPCNMNVGVMDSLTAPMLPGNDNSDPKVYRTAEDNSSPKCDHDLGTAKGVLTCSVETDSEGIDMKCFNTELASEVSNQETHSASVQCLLPNGSTPEMQVEEHVAKKNYSDTITSPCQDDGSGCINHLVSMGRQLQNDAKPSSFDLEKNPDVIGRPEQKTHGLADIINKENIANNTTKSYISSENVSKNNGQMSNSNCPERNSLHLPDFSYIDKKNQGVLTPPTEQLYSAKLFAKRQNYFAKDLREAVSRIRRHTAPDSDTDDDIDKHSYDSCSEGSGDVGENEVASCSSDTSDSEVTVILCEDDKEDLLSQIETTDFPPDVIKSRHVCKEKVAIKKMEHEDPDMTALKTDELLDQSNNSEISPTQQNAGLDLNSCIEGILQDLNRAEKEFFP